jgi:hypothetical protein
MPHYVIESKKPEAAAARLVEADNQAQALRYVVADTLSVRLAEPGDFIRLTKAGVECETIEVLEREVP